VQLFRFGPSFDQEQLPYEQGSLSNSGEEQEKRNDDKPSGVIGQIFSFFGRPFAPVRPLSPFIPVQAGIQISNARNTGLARTGSPLARGRTD
jgi:hypothetical protein